MVNDQEKRRHPRVNLTHVSVDVYDSTGSLEKPEMCYIVNISESGMLFTADFEEEIEDYIREKRIRLTFTLPENNIIIRTDAVIVHIKEIGLLRYLGVRFLNIGEAERKYLKDFVASSVGR